MRKVIIHYHRDDGAYEDWGIWLWPLGYGGQWVDFTETDYFGKIAVWEIPKKHRRLGFVIRGSSWEKDIDQDRYIEDFKGDTAEVWLVSGDPTIYLAPPARLRKNLRIFPELEVTFHYYRYDGDYSGWNLWIWGDSEPGRALEFASQDGYGYLARTVLKQQTDATELGFLLRKRVLGENWAEKDGTDRSVPLYWANDHGTLDVWLMQDDHHIYYRADDVDRTPRLTLASLEDIQTVRVETYLAVLVDSAPNLGFKLMARDEKGEDEVPISVCRENPRRFQITTHRPLDLHKEYRLEHQTHGKARVTFGGVFGSKEFQREFHYSGHDLGVRYSKKETTFKVWAPTASRLSVIIYASHDELQGEIISLERGERGVWSCRLRGDLEGLYYNFLVTHGERQVEVVDPYARATGANGLRGQIVDLAATNPKGWDKVKPLPLESPVDAVIYEAHIRDLSVAKNSGIKAQGQYLGLVEEGTKTPGGISTGLDHFRELGITHLHLLPIFDFATVDELKPMDSYNWGYDPLHYNVPEGSYASDPIDGRVRIRELKTMIQGLNQAGIGVIMDVVYNHTFHSLASSFHKLVPGYYYRHHPDRSFSNGSGCGNELADERSMVRKFIVDSVTYWAREYKLSGFRFDLMGLHTIETMQAVRRSLDLISKHILLYGEGWAAAGSTIPPEVRAMKENTVHLPGIASFCSDFRDGLKGHVFHTNEGGFVQGQGFEETVKFGIVGAIQHPQIDYAKVLYSKGPWAISPAQSVVYAEAHDNLTLWDKLLCTTAPEEEGERLKMMKLAHAILLTSQGIPFLHGGQDFARTKGGDPNSYQSPDHVNQIDWD
ncbi:MAG: type I pullulanase, partial [Firmicutes bacterium]|nr:type I pullulanase [Bacillota bacterium]